MTIQLRLTLWYTALLGITLVLFSGVIYYALARNLDAQLKADARVQAEEVRRYLNEQLDAPKLYSTVIDDKDPSIFSHDVFKLVEIPRPRVLAGSGDVQIFHHESGAILVKTRNLTNYHVPVSVDSVTAVQRRQDHFTRYGQGDMPLLVYSFPVETSRGVFGVQILQSLQPVEHMLGNVWRYLLLGTLLTLVLAALVGAYLARRALQPLTVITNTAGSISQTGDLGRRLSIGESTSEVGKLATTFNQMLDQIQQLFRTQERLVADVGHELRTPLTSIQGNVELLQRMAESRRAESRGQPTAEQTQLVAETTSETLNEVESETQRMSMMINDLLLVAQAESGNLVLREESVEMDTLLLEIYRETRKMVERDRPDGELEVRLGGEDQAIILGDRSRLRQLLLNLTENAIKYTPHAGTITLGLENRDGWVQVSVQDTGIGISEENQQHIFERFYRTDKARSRELGGSGLGLSIVQWIAQAHGGRVTVESEPQVGSTFTLWLPEQAG